MKFIHEGNIGERPLNFEKFKKYCEEEYGYDMSKPEKMVMCGD